MYNFNTHWASNIFLLQVDIAYKLNVIYTPVKMVACAVSQRMALSVPALVALVGLTAKGGCCLAKQILASTESALRTRREWTDSDASAICGGSVQAVRSVLKTFPSSLYQRG